MTRRLNENLEYSATVILMKSYQQIGEKCIECILRKNKVFKVLVTYNQTVNFNVNSYFYQEIVLCTAYILQKPLYFGYLIDVFLGHLYFCNFAFKNFFWTKISSLFIGLQYSNKNSFHYSKEQFQIKEADENYRFLFVSRIVSTNQSHLLNFILS